MQSPWGPSQGRICFVQTPWDFLELPRLSRTPNKWTERCRKYGNPEESALYPSLSAVPALPNNEFLTSRDFLVQPLNLQNYNEFEAFKYRSFSKCSTLGYYILRKSCILKPRIHGSFGGSKVGPENPEKLEIRC